MEDEERDNEKDSKKKKRPTLTYYQPPGSRSSRNPEIEKVAASVNAISIDEQNSLKEQKVSKNQSKNSDSGVRKPPQVEENNNKEINRPESGKKSYRSNRQITKENHQNVPKIENQPPETKAFVNQNFQKDEKTPQKQPTQAHQQQQTPPEVPKQIQNIPQPTKETPHRGGILKVNLDEINDSHMNHDDQNQRLQIETTDNTQYKTLFDPYNPTKPIYIQKSQHQQKIKVNYKSPDTKDSYQVYQQQIVQHQQIANVNAINEAKANTLIQMMHQLDQQLKALVEKCDYSRYKDFHDRINDMRKQLERLCMQSILTHIESSTKLNVDLNYWKLCYHQIIENLRKEYNYALNTLNDISYSGQIKSYLDFYINEGFEFYDHLIKELERTYGFDKSLYLDLNQLKPNSASKAVKLAILCVNRCLICLGDLARYRESFNEMKDYGVARSYYLKAMYLAPKCSRAYNQLAILALYTRRRLDAVYYYIRCLELNQPLQTARQSLVSLFDEARKRSEIITENLNKKKLRNKAASMSVYSNNNSNRVELWMKSSTVADNTVSKTQSKVKSEDDDDEDENDVEEGCIDDDNDSNELLNLSSVELNKRFMHDYLNLIGKLFTKVGMESYAEICSRMLFEFRELLKRKPCPIGKMRLLQLTVINISIVNLTKTASQHRESYNQNRRRGLAANISDDESEQQQQPVADESIVQRNQLQEFGVQLSLDMFAIIVKRLTRLLANYDTSVSDTTMREMFPSVKLFTDWMKQNLNLWYPLPDQLPPDLGPNPDLFQIISKFLNQISKIDSAAVGFQSKLNEENNLVPVVLDEDREIIGFLPLDTNQKEVNYAELTSDYDLEALKDYKRFNKMVSFGDYLLNLKKPVIKYDIMNRVYVPYVVKTASQEKEENVGSKDDSKVDDESLSNDDQLNEALAALGDDKELNDLIEKRKNLKAKVDEKLKRDQHLQTFVDTTSSRRIELEIRPRFLVPDTNCFIDHLNLIDTMLKSNRYIIVIPLLVINELEKLAKSISNYNDDSIEHAEMVQRNAKKAMEFLHEKFEKRERNLKALTSQGSTLETIQFRSEELKAQGTNDDLILGCCLHYCRDNARDFMPNDKNAAIHLFREVVLLTEDRNLRLKAHTRNVPVKNIINFCKWANLPLTNAEQQSNKRKSNKN